MEISDFQFGGIKKTGVNHFLIKMWNEILLGLENARSAVNIMSVDFSKAFNCLQHQACLQALARRGASNQTIRMIFNFLKDRRMVVKNGFNTSNTRKVTGGAPQGTKLGNVLFCLTVEGIHEDWTLRNGPSTELAVLSPVRHRREEGTVEEVERQQESPLAAIPTPYRRNPLISTPCTNMSINSNFKCLRNSMFNKQKLFA